MPNSCERMIMVATTSCAAVRSLNEERRYTLTWLAVLMGSIAMYNAARNPRDKLSRSGILPPRLSPWIRLYKHGDNGSFINMTGLSREAFEEIVRIVFPPHDNGIAVTGHPSLLKPCDKLGLYLMYVNSRMDLKALCLLFGLTLSPCSAVVDMMRGRVILYLQRHPFARIKWPTAEEMKVMARRVQLREPSVDNIIGFVDGVHCVANAAKNEMPNLKLTMDTTMILTSSLSAPLGKSFLLL